MYLIYCICYVFKILKAKKLQRTDLQKKACFFEFRPFFKGVSLCKIFKNQNEKIKNVSTFFNLSHQKYFNLSKIFTKSSIIFFLFSFSSKL